MPEAYWSNINWTVVALMITAIGGVAVPFFNGWWTNKTASTSTKAKRTETELERMERIQREQYERLEKRAEEAEHEAARCADECEQSRNQARGMEDWAHWLRHELLNLQRRFGALLEIAEKASTGEYANERFVEILRQTRAQLPVPPPNVPLMHDADKIRPP